jgi:hypothetical protein
MKSECGKYALGENMKVLGNIIKTLTNILCGLNAKYALHTIIAQYIGLFLWLLLIFKITLQRVLKARVPFFILESKDGCDGYSQILQIQNSGGVYEKY